MMLKSIKLVAIVAVITIMFGCASIEKQAYYSKEAKALSFEEVFESGSFAKTFDSLEDAYYYVNVAQAKFSAISGKSKNKGIAGWLEKPSDLNAGDKVRVGVSVWLSDGSKSLEFSNKHVGSSVSSFVEFTVIYKDRMAYIPSWYLAPNWVYSDGNSMVDYFNWQGNRIKINYPVGWGIDHAFDYLNHELE
jgi:hypothetical protein